MADTLIGTSTFGWLDAQTTAISGGYSATIRYIQDALNYVEFYVETGANNTAEIRVMHNGSLLTGNPKLIGTLPAGFGQAYFGAYIDELATGWKSFTLWVGSAEDGWASTQYANIAIASWLSGSFDWYNMSDSATGIDFGGADTGATPTSPNPNKSAWYAKHKETILDGSYGRIRLLNQDASVKATYSNGTNDTSLVSLNTTEHFDPTTTKTVIDSCRFSIHTPFSKLTPQADITAFLKDFIVNSPFVAERGWMTTVYGIDIVDTVILGYYFITDTKLNKETWILEVEGQDIFGLILDAKYNDTVVSAITDGLGLDSVVDAIMDSVVTQANVRWTLS